jgi:rfaE bifunctional protein kinase chain/domain/rfaE bifunctional protein nucleotidyltransferase chain/domain
MAQSSKIKDISALSEVLADVRLAAKKIVHCHGVFDLLHIGHIKHFNQAKKLGDILVVTLTADQYVNKGPHRPAFTQELRAEAIAALECVDFVAINHARSAVPAIEIIKPTFHVKGSEYREKAADPQSKLRSEEEAVIAAGGELVFTDDITFSSSNLINTRFNQFSEKIETYLKSFRSPQRLSDINHFFTKSRDLKVLVVGEIIIDEYRYCEAIGKAGKEPVLVTRYHSNEEFAGGTLAIANNIAGFVGEVGVLGYLGGENSRQDFIQQHLRENVRPFYLTCPDRPTITKVRYVEHYSLQKLFEVYIINDAPMSAEQEAQFLNALEQQLGNYDVVVVADYGHSLISETAVKILCEKSRFLSVNTQANAGNRGFHTISRYPRADYVSISQIELGLEMRSRDGDPQEMVSTVLKRIDCPLFTVTRGRKGILVFERGRGFSEGPSFTEHVVDRIGSGDAVLAVTSLAAALGASAELIAFLGNVVGSEAVKIVGHRSFLEANSLKKQINSILK